MDQPLVGTEPFEELAHASNEAEGQMSSNEAKGQMSGNDPFAPTGHQKTSHRIRRHDAAMRIHQLPKPWIDECCARLIFELGVRDGLPLEVFRRAF